jgi:hypothetical protein
MLNFSGRVWKQSILEFFRWNHGIGEYQSIFYKKGVWLLYEYYDFVDNMIFVQYLKLQPKVFVH